MWFLALFLLALFLGLFLSNLLLNLSTPLLPDFPAFLYAIQQLLVQGECGIVYLALVMLWGLVSESADANANIMLPALALVTGDPRLCIILMCLSRTTNASNDLDFLFFFFFLGCLL